MSMELVQRINPFLLVCLTLCGCTGWLPLNFGPNPGSGASEKKSSILGRFAPQEIPSDTVGIESILVRLSSLESQRISELWSAADEQVIAPELRLHLDANGLRVGKFSGHLPLLAEQWLASQSKRVDEDPMEQAGIASDVSGFTQIWRCRADQRKAVTVRNLPHDSITLFYNDQGFRGGVYTSPQFLFGLFAKPSGQRSAKLLLRPELEYGQTRRVVVAKDSAIRTEERRESIVWNSLAIDLQLQLGDCLMVGGTSEPRGLGEHFFRTRSKEGETQNVVLLLRVAELNPEDEFSVNRSAEAEKSRYTSSAIR